MDSKLRQIIIKLRGEDKRMRLNSTRIRNLNKEEVEINSRSYQVADTIFDQFNSSITNHEQFVIHENQQMFPDNTVKPFKKKREVK